MDASFVIDGAAVVSQSVIISIIEQNTMLTVIRAVVIVDCVVVGAF